MSRSRKRHCWEAKVSGWGLYMGQALVQHRHKDWGWIDKCWVYILDLLLRFVSGLGTTRASRDKPSSLNWDAIVGSHDTSPEAASMGPEKGAEYIHIQLWLLPRLILCTVVLILWLEVFKSILFINLNSKVQHKTVKIFTHTHTHTPLTYMLALKKVKRWWDKKIWGHWQP